MMISLLSNENDQIIKSEIREKKKKKPQNKQDIIGAN